MVQGRLIGGPRAAVVTIGRFAECTRACASLVRRRAQWPKGGDSLPILGPNEGHAHHKAIKQT